MIHTAFRYFLREVAGVFQRFEAGLAALGAERRCAVRLDHLAERLGGMGARINLVREKLGGCGMDNPVDIDAALRSALKHLKEDIREIRCQLAQLRRPGASARLQRAFAHLSQVAEATYTSADKLQWEIEEHDRHFHA